MLQTNHPDFDHPTFYSNLSAVDNTGDDNMPVDVADFIIVSDAFDDVILPTADPPLPPGPPAAAPPPE